MDLSHSHPPPNVALIVGVTGMAGLALAQRLKAQSNPWAVIGVSLRPPPPWFPSSLVDRHLIFNAVDSAATAAALLPLLPHVTDLFYLALQVLPHEPDNVSVNSLMLSNVLSCLTVDSPSALRHVSVQTGTKHYMGPIYDTALSAHLKAHETPFTEDLPRLPYPNFYYALEDVVASYAPKVMYSIHRSSIIIGASARSTYNTLLTLAVYAEICKYENAAFRYPGGRYTWEHFCDMTDARVLAEQHVWAAVTRGAQNEAFNCTNGDVFTWKKMWGVLSEEFGVEYQPLDEGEEEFDLTAEMEGKGEVWDRIVEEKGLCKTKMEEITCFGALQHVLRFNFQHVSSMNKSKEFGFFGFVDTFKSVRFWVGKLREMNIIP